MYSRMKVEVVYFTLCALFYFIDSLLLFLRNDKNITYTYCGPPSFKVDLPALKSSSHSNKLLAIPVAPLTAFLMTR